MPIINLDRECFCASGKTYGDCHYRKEFKHPMELIAEQQRMMNSPDRCLNIENGHYCGEPAIRSHSLQKESVLRSIAKNGHVDTFPFGIRRLLDISSYLAEERKPIDSFDRTGLTLASTFNGFCKKHDPDVFVELELDSATVPTQKQALLAAYRACCYESVITARQAGFFTYVSHDAKCTFPIEDLDNMKKAANNMAATFRDIWKRKEQYELLITEENARKVFFYHDVVFDAVLPMAATGSFFIDYGFQGELIQSHVNSHSLASCELWILPNSEGTTYAGIGGISDNNPEALKGIIDSAALVSQKMIATKFLQLASTNIENVFFNPEFIDDLSYTSKLFIIHNHLRNCASKEILGAEISREHDAISKNYTMSLTGNVLYQKTNYSWID